MRMDVPALHKPFKRQGRLVEHEDRVENRLDAFWFAHPGPGVSQTKAMTQSVWTASFLGGGMEDEYG